MSRILIVEDEKMMQELLTDVFIKYASKFYESDYKLDIKRAKDGIEALELIKDYNFELITVDIMLAKMDGWELIKNIRKDKDNFELPIVVVSAIDGIELEYNAKRVGATLWFTKPIRPKQFAEKVFPLIAGR